MSFDETFALDCGVLRILSNVAQELGSSPTLPSEMFVTTDVVWDGELPPDMKGCWEKFIRVEPVGSIKSTKKLFYGRYRARRPGSTRNTGEDSLLAYCVAEDANAKFVAADFGALGMAIIELGPHRVLGAGDLWKLLLEKNLIDEKFEAALQDSTARKLGFDSPPARLQQ